MFYKVFKLKYFPNCSVMDEEVKLKGLYVWQSIMKAWRVVRLGSRWHIGDDRLVVIWKDRRLPDLNSNRIISPIRNFPSIIQVCALIDEDNSCWIEDRVLFELFPHEANTILSLPLGQNRSEDVLIWSTTKNGRYSTKTTYRLFTNEVSNSTTSPSNPNAHKKFL